MKKKWVILLVLAAAVVLMAGCKKQAEGAFIGIAMPETGRWRWDKDGNSLKAEAEKRGYRAEVQYGEVDQPTQNQQIQNFLDQGAKLLVVGCIDDSVDLVISVAAHNNVTVIAYDRIIASSENYDYYITFNNFKVGVYQAQSLVDALELDSASADEPKQIALFAGSSTDGNAFFFFDGAMSVLNPYIESGVLNVVGPYPKTSTDTANFQRIAIENWQESIAKTHMEDLLAGAARNVTLDAILSPNDKLARAFIEACKADAKYQDKLPLVTGQDAEFDSAVMIKSGEQYSTVFKDTAKLAEATILLADAILKDQPPNIPGAVLAEGDLKEIGNTGRKYVNTYLLDPILVTKENLNVPVDAGFYEADEVPLLK